ncbi:MAG: ATP-binding domain-containing protein [Bacteroidetes bacterium]|nr:ATP-binding domain-containing protein [Bacteroidota bacterium]
MVRGDALRILNTVAGIKTAEVSKIYRQKNEEYKKAMEHLSKGNIKEGFETLNAIDFIKSIDPLKPSEQLIDDYMGSIKRNKSALIVSPTHEQGNKINAALRQKLKEEDLIDSHDKKATKLSNLNLTEAQKKDIRNFQEGMVLQFNQNVPQIKRGSQWQIESIHQNQFTLKDNEGNKRNLPFSKIKKFDVFEKSEMGLSKGDKIAITRNGYDNDKRRLSNGQSLEVVSIDKDGIITVRNNQSRNIYNLPKNFGHISYAYCMTSHASQGKTVDEVFISQPSSTFNATNAKQFYVSASRAKDKAHIYTDDKEALLEYASQLGDRQSALELTQNKHQKIAIQKIREKNLEPSKQKQAVEIERPKHNKQKTERDYEPGW